jgi:hypothetical protein
MPQREPTFKESMAKREREIRIVQGIFGGVSGAVVAGYFFGTIGVIVGAIAGASAGYAKPLWRSGLD